MREIRLTAPAGGAGGAGGVRGARATGATRGAGALAVPAALAALLLFAAGCGCEHGMRAFDVRVDPGPGLFKGEQASPFPVDVHLVGVGPRDYAKWAAYPMTDYWRPDDPLRKAALASGTAYPVLLSATDQPATKVLPVGNAVWRKWRAAGVDHLFVLAFLPNAPRPEAQRLFLPLDRCRWKEDQHALNIIVGPTGLTTTSVPEPVEE